MLTALSLLIFFSNLIIHHADVFSLYNTHKLEDWWSLFILFYIHLDLIIFENALSFFYDHVAGYEGRSGCQRTSAALCTAQAPMDIR